FLALVANISITCCYVTELPSLFIFFSYSSPPPHDFHSFPTRRSSDLSFNNCDISYLFCLPPALYNDCPIRLDLNILKTCWDNNRDRKSTRLNSSHVSISYAVFCLKKKSNRSIQATYTLRYLLTHG